MSDAMAALEALWRRGGAGPGVLERVSLTGQEPALPGIFKVGTAASATIAAAGLSASAMWCLRTGRAQTVQVDMRAAAVAFRSECYLRIDDGPSPDLWSPLSIFYRAGDARWIQLHCNFPHQFNT